MDCATDDNGCVFLKIGGCYVFDWEEVDVDVWVDLGESFVNCAADFCSGGVGCCVG